MNYAQIILALSGIAVLSILRRNHLRRNPNKDFISELSDDILISIITRIRTKESTRTSLLSKRWRDLYKFVPDIDIRCGDLIDCSSKTNREDHNLIVEAVDRFLRLRSDSTKIRSFSFCLCCIFESHTDHFQRWMCSIGKLGVEELVLDFRCFSWKSDLPFSFSLVYEIPSLKYLKLDLCNLYPHMEKTQFNSLQILIIHNAGVYPGALDSILSTCLSLHTLSIDSCRFPPAAKLSFCGPNLQLKYLYILESTRIEHIRLCASNLITFEFKHTILNSIIFEHVPQLQSVFIIAHMFNILSYVFGKLPQDLPQLKSLAFATAPGLTVACEEPVGINLFSNLKQLDFRVHRVTDMDLLSLIPFLQSCPVLQELHLDTSALHYFGPPVNKRPIIFHSELKKVELSGFAGTDNELEFALFILKSAVSLELMHISRCRKVYVGFGSWEYIEQSPWSMWTHRKIQRKLRCQAISKTAQLVIQHESQHEKDKWGRSGGYYDITTLETIFKLNFN